MNNECSPFLKKDMPNMAFDVRNSEMSEEEAYMMSYTRAQGTWHRPYDDTNDDVHIMHYYDYIKSHTSYFAICGARGCIRACMNMLEKGDRIENKFHNQFYKKSWLLPNKPEKVSTGVNPFRDKYLDEKYPGIRKNEYDRVDD